MFTRMLITFGFFALFAAIESAFDLYRRPGVLTMRELGASLVSLGNSLLMRGVVGVAALAAAKAVIHTAEGRAVVVS